VFSSIISTNIQKTLVSNKVNAMLYVAKKYKISHKKYSHAAMTCCNIMSYLYSSLSNCSTTVFENNKTFHNVFDHFQVFTIAEICFTIKLCLTSSETRFFAKITHAHKIEEFHECLQSQKCWKFRKEFSSTFCICQKLVVEKYAKFEKYANKKNVCQSPPKMPN